MDELMKIISSTNYVFLEFNLFTIILGIIMIISAFFVITFKKEKDIITMIGIFGTFSGIVAGLHSFNTDDITGSIPQLIGGLKTAFYTSIIGLAITIILNIFERKDDNKDEVDFLKDIKDEIVESNRQNQESNKLIIEKLSELNKGIGGDSDNSLVNQIKLLKSDSNENHRELKKSFDEFAEKMAENNMKGLIEAIKQVMEDFNTKINDQLGESFKELTNAIDNLLKWQNEYKENIITQTESLNLSKESLEKSSKGFEITVEKSENFAGISEKLGDELKNLNSSLEIFKNGINEFDGVAKNTKEMSDSMIKSIDSLTENFVSKAETMVGESEKQITMMKDSFSELSTDLRENHKNILDDLKQNVDNTNKNVSEQFERIGNELEKQTIKLDNELGEALDKSLSSLGQELTSITNKFTQQLSDLNNVINNIK